MAKTATPGQASLLPGDWAVLALLCEQPSHGFALARLVAEDGELGQVWTMSRPRVYHAIEDLRRAGLVEALESAPSARGPARTQLAPTAAGTAAVEDWLARPVSHVREARSELLLKLVLTQRAGRDLRPLAASQLEVLEQLTERIVGQLETAEGTRALVLRFRLAQTRAARAYVGELLV